MPDRCVIAGFSDPDEMVAAVQRLREYRLRIHDVYAPYPVHGLDAAMGIRRTRLPWVALVAALTGCLGAIGFQFFTSVVDWRMNVGGKPDNSTLAFLPITFELSVLCGGLAIVAALFIRAGLYPGRSGALLMEGVTDHRFAVAVRVRDRMQADLARELLFRGGGTGIEERGIPR